MRPADPWRVTNDRALLHAAAGDGLRVRSGVSGEGEKVNEEFVVLPPFGHPDACVDYDEDCMQMTTGQRFRCCFSVPKLELDGQFHAAEPRVGICPFFAD